MSPPDPEKRRRRSDGALNRSRVIEAAKRELAVDPSASLAAIAKTAQVSRGLVYRHFSSRGELIEAVRQQSADDAEANQDDKLRPAGELASATSVPLSVTDVLNKVPPFQIGEQIVAEVQRLPGVTSSALYLVELDGVEMQRLAGSMTFPERLPVPLAVGPEIPREGVAALRADLETRLPRTAVAPLFLRGRAIGVLLAVGTDEDALRTLTQESAVALSAAEDYTDWIATRRRVRATSPAAEIQQNLLPPRIVRIAGATLAGNVLPGYEIGGDWFDYAENPTGTWLGIADTEGTGSRAAAIGSVLLGAFRAARHQARALDETVLLMHAALVDLGLDGATATSTIAHWNSTSALLTCVTCGGPEPLLITADGQIERLEQQPVAALGSANFPDRVTVVQREVDEGERLVLLSDGVLDRPTGEGGTLGEAGVLEAALKAPANSAASTLRAIEDAVRNTETGDLLDDATLVILALTEAQPTS